MDVKLVSRTLDLFELFASERVPLSLTEIARSLAAPPSSCLALIRTLVSRGYLYEVRKRGGYYPTRRLAALGNAVEAVDPVIGTLHPLLAQHRDTTGETAVLAKAYGSLIVYLDVVESKRSIRCASRVGESQPLYVDSIGKAIFGELSEDAQTKLGRRISFQRFTSSTVSNLVAPANQGREFKARGWSADLGEGVRELSSVAIAFEVSSELYGISIVGPTQRIRDNEESHVIALLDAKQWIFANETLPSTGI